MGERVDTAALAFCDCETTGLDPYRHEVWEVGLVLRTAGGEAEFCWQLAPVDVLSGDPKGLEISGFHDRYDAATAVSRAEFARQFSVLTAGCHLVGNVVSFDAERLSKVLITQGYTPGWHYHLIDVEALAVGYLAGYAEAQDAYIGRRGLPDIGPVIAPPWSSDALMTALGVTVDEAARHTALGDARWARDVYDRIMEP